ncbi:flotillin family protein [Pseudomonas amygdali]|uniref:Band 7 domain-containing protein n=2 Tax=Pseudomonas amygdali pv. lachrymans TaxID=53707 RepID=A0ABR5KSL3_PSEAV|nr:flotillin family protein [Pseudomonas amygdali]AXH60237.1 flotillin family protein [Pseudomonas amygdali pv. lachrymans str. M301315]KPC17635.1 Uncharacterized protein AC499_0837 [Pseudomonas amygdali pv. lachrymans]RMT06124.1 hypothetical protein ALP54_04069 [Pseudomonas amygdali pv. lachrymans]
MLDFLPGLMMWVVPILIGVALIMMVIKQYKICPSDKLMVVFGAGSKEGARVVHGGGKFVVPFIQSFKFLSLAPISIAVNLEKALSRTNIRVNLPSQFTIAIDSKNPAFTQNAVRNLLEMSEQDIKATASEIIIGALRSTVAALTIEELTRDRDAFIKSINENVTTELNKIGMGLINVNIRDVTDESGFIAAMGQKAAAEAINKANIDVSEQVRLGDIGTETNKRERDVTVAQQQAEAEIGKKTAEKSQVVKTAALAAETTQGQNASKALIAESDAELAVKQATAFQSGEVARAKAETAVSLEQRAAREAELSKEQLASAEVARKQLVIEAEAQAQQAMIIAEGEAKAILVRLEAEAAGLQKMLEAKATGYAQIIQSAGGDPAAAANLLLIEKMEEIVRINAEAIKSLKIDKITVWDSGNGVGGNGGLPGFLKGFASSLPALNELAKQAGINLPPFLGNLVPSADPNALELPAPAAAPAAAPVVETA